MSLDFMDTELLASADARTVAALVTATADLTLVVDRSDVISDLSHTLNLRSGADIRDWRGRHVDSVVETGSLSTLQGALKRAREGRPTHRFDVSHVIDGERDLPVQYSALRVGQAGSIVLVGRDLRPIADLHSRLMASRQTVEQVARSHKQTEATYRLLFETGSDAIVFVDTASGKVRELNARAATLLGISAAAASGRRFASFFDKARQADVKSMLAGVVASGIATRLRVDVPAGGALTLSAELFRAGELTLTMVRLAARTDAAEPVEQASEADIDALVRDASEAIVLTGTDGSVLWVNESFLVLTGIPLAAHALGRPVAEFFAWSNVERETLFENVDRHGRVSSFAGKVRGAKGQTTDVELSAIAIRGGSTPGYGLVMRVQQPEEAGSPRSNSDLMRTAENVVEMIGRVPMKDLVRDTTDVIERMCIEAALRLTGNNRASTARVLGLSRQALYLKMHRFGIADTE